jgi:hypothetical protein
MPRSWCLLSITGLAALGSSKLFGMLSSGWVIFLQPARQASVLGRFSSLVPQWWKRPTTPHFSVHNFWFVQVTKTFRPLLTRWIRLKVVSFESSLLKERRGDIQLISPILWDPFQDSVTSRAGYEKRGVFPTTLYLHRLMTRSACPPGLAGSRL